MLQREKLTLVILKDQTWHPPICNEGMTSERIKGHVSEHRGLAGWQNDWHPRTHCLCSLQCDPVVFAEHWVQVQAVLSRSWQRRKHLWWRWMQSWPGPLSFLNSRFKPRLFLVSGPGNSAVWYLVRNSWNILECSIWNRGWVYPTFERAIWWNPQWIHGLIFLADKLYSPDSCHMESELSLWTHVCSMCYKKVLCLAAQSCPTLWWTVAHQAPLSMGIWGENTGGGSPALLQGIFPTQGSRIASGFFPIWATSQALI